MQSIQTTWKKFWKERIGLPTNLETFLGVGIALFLLMAFHFLADGK